MKGLATWQLILQSLRQDIPVMLLYVLESSGSSPGRQGFFMAVNANNEIEGSIGGGIMEHKFVEMAKERLQGPGYDVEVRKQIHDKSAAKNQSGMICSGEQTILLCALTPDDDDDMGAITELIDSMEQYKNGSLQLSPAGISFLPTIPANDFHFEMRSESDWKYVEKTGYKNRLYIIGGGIFLLRYMMTAPG
jgi:xanthine dehydrogenase accessory factor